MKYSFTEDTHYNKSWFIFTYITLCKVYTKKKNGRKNFETIVEVCIINPVFWNLKVKHIKYCGFIKAVEILSG